jgi:hypothetical protein
MQTTISTIRIRERPNILLTDEELRDILESNAVEGDHEFMWEVRLFIIYHLFI